MLDGRGIQRRMRTPNEMTTSHSRSLTIYQTICVGTHVTLRFGHKTKLDMKLSVTKKSK